jgi:DNA-directed RNA polymerase subunit RPC12/RpoP
VYGRVPLLYGKNARGACGNARTIRYDFNIQAAFSTGPALIRFKCPNCGRRYEVLQALKDIPLLCKGCGQRVDVPESSQEPDPVQDSLKEKSDPSVPVPHTPVSAVFAADEKAIDSPELKDLSKIQAASETSLPEKEPATPQQTQGRELPEEKMIPPEGALTDEASEPSRMKPLPIFVDVMFSFFLLLVGGMCGETLAKKSTGDVWRDAGSAPTFPPIDLLLWLTPPTLLLLIYGLLISRQKSIGALIQSKSES